MTCSGEFCDEATDFSDSMIRGLYDEEIRAAILGWEESKSLKDTVKFVNAKESGKSFFKNSCSIIPYIQEKPTTFQQEKQAEILSILAIAVLFSLKVLMLNF